jgi:hypothetical protein
MTLFNVALTLVVLACVGITIYAALIIIDKDIGRIGSG